MGELLVLSDIIDNSKALSDWTMTIFS